MAVLPTLDVDATDLNTRTEFFYVWHIITIENLVFGVAFIFMAFCKDLSKVKFAAWTIGIIMITRWIIISGSTLLKNKIGLIEILMDTIAILIVVVLIILGTRVKNKISV